MAAKKKSPANIQETILAKIFVKDDVIDYRFKYNNPVQGMALVTYLEKMKLDVLSKLFPEPDKESEI